MAVQIDTATFPNLTAQPFGYDTASVTQGLSARRWTITGLLTPAEWIDLLDVYDTWRDIRIDEPDSVSNNSVGTTVSFSGAGAGETWTNVACWFFEAPQGEQSGGYIRATVSLIDANQALEVGIRSISISEEEETAAVYDYGTFTLNGAVITLTKPIDGYDSTPTVELTAGGNHFISGPRVVVRLKNIEGTTNLSGWNALKEWYEDTITAAAAPASGSYFPMTPPELTEIQTVVENTTTVDRYTVALQLKEIV